MVNAIVARTKARGTRGPTFVAAAGMAGHRGSLGPPCVASPQG